MLNRAMEYEKYTRFFVGGVYRQISEDDLLEHFSSFGQVVAFDLKRDLNGNSRGYGWLLFDSPVPDLVVKGPHVLKGITLNVEVPHCSADEKEEAFSASRRQALQKNDGEKYSETGSFQRPRRGRHDSQESADFARRSRSRSRSSDTHSRGRRTRRRHETRRNDAPDRFAQQRSPLQQPRKENIVPSSPHGLPPTAIPKTPETASASEMYACIPLSLCPQQYFADPRIFCARLDPGRIGSLSIVQLTSPKTDSFPPTTTTISANPLYPNTPTAGTASSPYADPTSPYSSYLPAHLTSGAPRKYTPYNGAGPLTSVPPPPGPPPSRNSAPPPPGPPPNHR